MTQLLLLKEIIKTYIGKHEVYFKPLGKFLLSLLSLLVVNGAMGYMEKMNSFSVVMVVALMCSFMPTSFIAICAGLFVVMHSYALSMECAIIVLALFLILYLLYYRFSPKDTLVVILMPMLFFFKLPYVLPICMGLLATPVSAVSVACGVIVYYTIHFMTENVSAIGALETEAMSNRIRFIVDGLMNNKTMIIVMVAFAATVILVYTIRRLPIDHSWTIAIMVGTLIQMLILLVGNLVMDTDVSVLGIIVGSMLTVGMAKIVEFLTFNLDYSRTENVQFEDDEYYYYVKAVPKVNVSKTTKTVKKINSQRKKKRI